MMLLRLTGGPKGPTECRLCRMPCLILISECFELCSFIFVVIQSERVYDIEEEMFVKVR